mmetsp:Transcript_32056/g.75575  ORF Transcript_32056/g.75575 Transcript_32056/m.75575 type:complete len:339 (-) Transcript_32056:438-1454(-)
MAGLGLRGVVLLRRLPSRLPVLEGALALAVEPVALLRDHRGPRREREVVHVNGRLGPLADRRIAACSDRILDLGCAVIEGRGLHFRPVLVPQRLLAQLLPVAIQHRRAAPDCPRSFGFGLELFEVAFDRVEDRVSEAVSEPWAVGKLGWLGSIPESILLPRKRVVFVLNNDIQEQTTSLSTCCVNIVLEQLPSLGLNFSFLHVVNAVEKLVLDLVEDALCPFSMQASSTLFCRTVLVLQVGIHLTYESRLFLLQFLVSRIELVVSFLLCALHNLTQPFHSSVIVFLPHLFKNFSSAPSGALRTQTNILLLSCISLCDACKASFVGWSIHNSFFGSSRF